MANDVFGILILKPTAAGGETFFMDNNNFANQSRVIGDGFGEEGGYWTASGDFRANIEISTGFSDDDCSRDQQEMVDRGYMQSPNDWKNVEFTCEVQIFNSASDHATFGFRGSRHTANGNFPRCCTGCNYKVSVDMDGSGIQIRKESWHVSYHDCDETQISGWQSTDGPFRIKILCYNSSDNQSVTTQVYLDQDLNNNFVKVLDFTDSGQVNNDADACNCNDSSQPLVWGSPTILIRADEGEYGIKNLSIREIDPFGSGGGGDDPGGGGSDTPSSSGYTTSGITASGDDGNVPSNTRDGNFSTRWSSFNNGGGEWIRYDLGQSKPVDEVKIAWFKGDQRVDDYEIETSPNDSTWTGQTGGIVQASGSTTGLQSTTFSSVDCRYVRVTGHGNTDNEWVSITEVEIHGTASDPGGGGQDPGGGGGTPPPETTADFNIMETIFSLDYNAIGLCNPVGV
ncbi:MAG: discoidin domain-containing protein [Candidatus Nitrosocosmicus sp.]|nr:discoidin domain-containing protein [Candidatus Nitrosocosmicus sp.]MDN5865948.1 discoidin domain-containing protein [Candidatus Nitrosocosmicus sp.]